MYISLVNEIKKELIFSSIAYKGFGSLYNIDNIEVKPNANDLIKPLHSFTIGRSSSW